MTEVQPNTPNPQTAAAKAALFAELEKVKWHCVQGGCNLNDQVISLILACLDEGLTARPVIVGTVAHLGYNSRHVGKMLNLNVGHMWHRDGLRFYKALPPLAEAS